jgi:predicted DNA-binding transcriptional regulator AlpA
MPAQKNTFDAVSGFDSLPGSAFIRLPVVLALKGCSRVTVWRQVKDGIFPAPHKLGARMVGWRVSEVRAALAGAQK